MVHKQQISLNDEKAEAVHILSKFKVSSSPYQSAHVSVAPEAQSLGVVLDQLLTLGTHLSNICKAAYLSIRDIGKIRLYLDKATTERLAHAFIYSRLDYCNNLL